MQARHIAQGLKHVVQDLEAATMISIELLDQS